MPIPKTELRKCLIDKFGFEEVYQTKHEAVALFVKGKKVATTRFSHGQNEIDDDILGLIARQIRVQLGYLKKMCNCNKSKEEYLSLLKNSGFLI